MVSYTDGSVLAQLGNPDMRTPIAHALAWPERIDAGVKPLDFLALSSLTFDAPDMNRFPCLRLAMEAINNGGAMTTVLNAANEIAVAAFLNREISFPAIPALIEKTLENMTGCTATTLDEILAVDLQARDITQANIISNKTPEVHYV